MSNMRWYRYIRWCKKTHQILKNCPFHIYHARLWKFRSTYPDMFLVVCLTIYHDTWQEIRLKDTQTSLSGLILVARSHKSRNGGFFEHNLKRQAILKICRFFYFKHTRAKYSIIRSILVFIDLFKNSGAFFLPHHPHRCKYYNHSSTLFLCSLNKYSCWCFSLHQMTAHRYLKLHSSWSRSHL